MKLGEFELNHIYNIDCLEGMKKLPDNCIDLVVTSPPYDNLRNYNGYSFDFEKIAKELFRIMKETGIVVWVVGDKIEKGNRSLTSFRQCLFFQQIGFKVHDVMIYRKKNTPFMRSNAYTNCHEFMFVFAKDKVKTFNPIKTKEYSLFINNQCFIIKTVEIDTSNFKNDSKNGDLTYLTFV